jgi:GNAT superfamily N-acetyltransferase
MEATNAPNLSFHHEMIRVVENDSMLDEYCQVAGAAAGYDPNELLKLFSALLPLKGSVLFCVHDQGRIVGTGHIYVDDRHLASIAAIGVLEPFRRRGLGTQLMHAATHYGKLHQAQTYSLYASEMGAYLYKHLGFQAKQDWNFRIF